MLQGSCYRRGSFVRVEREGSVEPCPVCFSNSAFAGEVDLRCTIRLRKLPANTLMKMRSLSVLLSIAFVLLGVRLYAAEKPQKLKSPNGVIAVELRITDRIRYDVAVNETLVLQDSTLSLKVDDVALGLLPRLKSATPRAYEGTLRPVVRQKAAVLREHYNELRLEFEGGYTVVFRVYDEGVAYRWETALPAAQVKVFAEEVALNFPGNFKVFYPEEEG